MAELALVCSLASCVNVSLEQRPGLERNYFALDIDGTHPSGQTATDGILKLAPVRVAHRYDSTGFTYRIGADSFETDFYNRFLVAPGPMLTDELRQVLVQARLFDLVVDSSSLVDATHLLEPTLDALYGDFTGEGSGSAVVAMSFVLGENHGSVKLVQKRYQKVVPLETRSAAALVDGWNRGLDEIAEALLKDLRAANEARAKR
jgi:uncharacterized lipoprotein YmbA